MSLRVKIFISLLLTLFLAGNFLFLNPNKVLAQADPLSPAILLQNYLTQLETAKQTAIQQKDTQTLKIIEQEIKDTKKQQRKQWLKDTWVKLRDKVLLRSVNIAYKNALRTFLSRLAFDTATRIAEGGLGKSPLFNIKKLGSFVDEVYETTLVDTLDILAKDNGFFKFDICQPGDINLKLAIQYSLFGNFAGRGARGKPRCTFRQISERWTEWSQQVGRTFSSDNLLRTLKDSFSPVQSDVGIYLKLDSSIRDKLADQKTKEMFDYVSREGIQPLTEPITGFIKTPAAFTSEQAKQALAKNAPIPETIQTKDIIADAFGIFTNTLASKLMKRLLEKGLTEGHRAQTTMVFNWVNQQVARSGAAQAFAQLAEIHPSASVEPIAEFLSQCPDAARPGPTDCVINANLLGALEQHLTVKEALKNGQLRGDGLVGYKNGNQPLNYLNHFHYRSLVIMRIHRLIPVGWELAALYNIRTSTEKSLQEIVNCFEDKNPANINNPRYPANCVADTNRDGTVNDSDYNPYYHLIDPHWVLKAPESLCRRRGFGYDIVSSSMDCVEDNVDGTKEKEGGELVEGPSCEAKVNPDKEVLVVQRSEDYCADRQTCLAHDASGKCLGEYGYCLKEKDIWRFPGGQSCDLTPYYNTCETLSRTADSQEFSYLRNTLQPCDEIDGGCLWYSTQGRRVVANSVQTWPWQSDSRIYLNDRAGDCPANQVGCTKLSRMLPGVNTVFNGDFKLSLNDQTPDGWVLTENRCQLAYSAENKILTVLPNVDFPANAYCIVESAGFIPVDVNFEYALSVALKRNSQLEKKAEVGLKFFNATKNPMGSARYNILDNDNGVSLTPAEEWQVYQATSTLPEGAHFAKIILATGPFDANNEEDLGEVSFDSLQLVITKSPVVRHNLPNFSFNPDDQEDYNTDYSQDNSYARQYLKVAPSYLVCQGYNEILPAYNDSAACLNDGHYWRSDLKRCALSGDDRCDNYALECKANEVGCQGYLPANGDPEVSGVTTNADVCPETCVGYNHYLEAPTYFDKVEDPAAEKHAYDFIPETAQACPVAAAGCEQFTNLSGQSSEESEYFTYLRQCVQRNANANFYYTWEGSDTTGFQLKKWEFLKSNLDEGPCTNVTLGVTGCSDTQAHQADNGH